MVISCLCSVANLASIVSLAIEPTEYGSLDLICFFFCVLAVGLLMSSASEMSFAVDMAPLMPFTADWTRAMPARFLRT